jgi:hypothetical protein
LHYFFQYVPCNVRAFLAEYIEEEKKANYTKFCGGEWNIFAADYELRAGDRIEFELPDEGLNLEIQTYRDNKRLLPLPHVGRYLILQTLQTYLLSL